MIVYDKFWNTLKRKKVTSYALREKHGVSSKTLTRMRRNEYLSLRTIDDLCKILNCKIGDIVEYKKDDAGEQIEK